MSILGKLLLNTRAQRQDDRDTELYNNLIRREARMGGEIFGPIAPGGKREFFCLDERTWIWHEEWLDKDGKRQIKTTRYDVRPKGIFKAQNGQHYHFVGKSEAERLRQAASVYEKRIRSELYANYV